MESHRPAILALEAETCRFKVSLGCGAKPPSLKRKEGRKEDRRKEERKGGSEGVGEEGTDRPSFTGRSTFCALVLGDSHSPKP